MKVCLPGTRHEFSTPHGSGAHRVMYELYRSLVGIKKQGFTVEKVEFDTLPVLSEGFSPYVRSAFYDFSDYDIIHNLAPRPLCLSRRGAAATLATVHDLRVLTAPETREEDRAGIRRRLGAYLVLEKGARFELNCDYMCASSTQTVDEAVSLGYDKKRIFLVSLGIDRRFMAPVRKKARSKSFTVGTMGASSSTKNAEFAIRAFNMLPKDFKGTFDVWGKPSSIGYYSTLMDARNGNRKIVLRGFAPENDIVKIYDSFDAFVYPSKYEGFGLNIIDAQARGLPVILCKGAMIPKEVRKYCIEAKDEAHMAEIIEGLAKNGYSERERKRAMEYARGFTWEKTAKRTLEVYTAIMAKG